MIEDFRLKIYGSPSADRFKQFKAGVFLCHVRGHPAHPVLIFWIPAFVGMTFQIAIDSVTSQTLKI
jgi:hypothetical protein